MAPFWANFDFMDSHVLLNFQILEKWWNVKFFTSKNTHSSKWRIFYFVWSRYIALKLLWKIWGKDVKEGPPFEKSGKKTSSTRGPRLKNLGKRRQRVVPIWKIWEKDVKEGLCFTFSSKYFIILLLSYNLSHFAPLFKKIDKKFPDIRNLLFLCNEELHKKFVQFW